MLNKSLCMHSSRKYIAYGSLLTGLMAFFAVSVASQGSGPGSIQGKVVLPNGNSLGESVRVSLETMRGVKALAFTDNQGQFQFGRLSPGIYQVIVEGNNQFDTTTSNNIEIFPNAPAFLTIVLKAKKSPNALKDPKNVVSATELNTAIPANAQKEFDQASSAVNQGKSDEAIAHLRKAIAIFPDYLMARNDLGAQLLGQGKLDEAENELRRAVGIDPKAFKPELNLGIVLVYQHRFSEATEALRRALSMQSNSASARLHMGMALMGQNDLDGAEKELKLAYDFGGNSFSLALFHLGQVYMSKGERALALQAFEAYLREVPDAANAAQARKLIGILR